MNSKIYSPVEGYNGISAGVLFVDGVGVTENEWAKKWLVDRGYKVESVSKKEPSKKEASNKEPVKKKEE